jgi:hypothetical protein
MPPSAAPKEMLPAARNNSRLSISPPRTGGHGAAGALRVVAGRLPDRARHAHLDACTARLRPRPFVRRSVRHRTDGAGAGRYSEVGSGCATFSGGALLGSRRLAPDAARCCPGRDISDRSTSVKSVSRFFLCGVIAGVLGLSSCAVGRVGEHGREYDQGRDKISAKQKDAPARAVLSCEALERAEGHADDDCRVGAR